MTMSAVPLAINCASSTVYPISRVHVGACLVVDASCEGVLLVMQQRQPLRFFSEEKSLSFARTTKMTARRCLGARYTLLSLQEPSHSNCK